MNKLLVPMKTGGKRNQLTLPAIGLGTSRVGDRKRALPTDAADVEFICDAMRMGVTHIDTAARYQQGRSEQLIGEAIKTVDRDTLFLTSKVLPEHLDYDALRQALHQTLERLGTDYLDLYLVHEPSITGVPISETLRAMRSLVDEGLVRHVGLSKFDKPLLEEALAVTEVPVDNLQISYSLAIRDYEEDGTIALAREHGMLVTAYRPLLQGKMLTEAGGVAVLAHFANKYQCTPAQLALAWLLRQEQVVTICRTTNHYHLRDNLLATTVNVSADDATQLSGLFPTKKRT